MRKILTILFIALSTFAYGKDTCGNPSGHCVCGHGCGGMIKALSDCTEAKRRAGEKDPEKALNECTAAIYDTAQ